MVVTRRKKRVVGSKNKTKTEPKPEFVLPDEPSEPAEDLKDYSILLYGEKKIGKTTLTSQFENAFHIMTEPGGRALRIYQKPATTWPEFKGWVSAIVKESKKAKPRFGTVIVDTIDNAYKFCFEWVCKVKLGVEHPSDEEWGKGWQAIADEFNAVMNRLLSVPNMGKIFISHSKEIEMKTRLGKKYDKIMPTMKSQASQIIEAVVDIWAYYAYDGERRVLLIEGDDHVAAGHRLENHFRFPNGDPVREIPMGRSPKEAHRNFVAAFNNELSNMTKVGNLTKKGGTAKTGTKKKTTKKVVRKRA